MNSQLFLNNFDSQFIASVKGTPVTGTPATELDYGIIRLPQSAGAVLGTLSNGDYYTLTAFKRSGSVETAVEIMKATFVDTSVINETRLTVLRGQEGTTPQAYVSGDYISMRATAFALSNFIQKNSSSADLSFTQTGTGATQRTVQSKLAESVSVKDFGAVGDGTADDTTAIQAALNSGAKLIFFPLGNYKTTATLTISASGIILAGIGSQGGLGSSSTITSSAAGPAINVATSLTGVGFYNLAVSRPTGTAIAGYDGIKYTELTEQARISNVRLTRHWVGLSLCATSYSYVTELFTSNNYSHGVLVANNATFAGLQWSFLKCLSQTNDGYGLLYSTAAGVAPASVGDISLFSTYANKLGGVKFAGAASSPINAIRWFGGFVGEDGGHGMELDTYGTSNHKIEGLFAELAGVSACGVGSGTIATHVGMGIKVTANNTAVDLISCEVIGNSYTGIEMSAARFSIVGCNVRINGAANSAGQKNGIRVLAGQGSITGGSSKGHASFGIYLDVDTVSVLGVDVRENITSGIAGASIVNSPIIGNMGSSVVNYGTTETGWTAMTGTGDKATAYATSTVTLAQLAGRVKQMQDALMAMKILST